MSPEHLRAMEGGTNASVPSTSQPQTDRVQEMQLLQLVLGEALALCRSLAAMLYVGLKINVRVDASLPHSAAS